ncbi:cysteine desulfurase family protein [Sphingomonas sp. MMS24-J13]|uniref:cysteine desulfurase family protein n=1 Tax=Sphingomonas sp. MMS24-J13 TaxID=3238686 RepID=UPI00385133BC
MIYLDYQATTRIAPEARDAMQPWLDAKYGNPHSPHRMGREAAAAIAVARRQIVDLLIEGRPEAGQLYFTSGATEAANWAIKGTFSRLTPTRNRIVTVATEHACVLDSVRALERFGADVVVLPVGANGLVDLDRAHAAIDERTALVAAMLVNNEIGTIGPIAALGAIARAAGAMMFCDAVQGLGRVTVPVEACDLIALTAHKIHGPKGIGALWIRHGCEPEPLLHGGGQEGGVRSGTLSPALCVGFGTAATIAQARLAADATYVDRLNRRFRDALGPEWRVNGSLEQRYAGNLNLRREGLDVGRLMSELRDIAFSAGSACASGSGRPSHVLKAIGLSDTEARSSIRLGFGRYTTEAEIDEAAELINAAVARQLEWA